MRMSKIIKDTQLYEAWGKIDYLGDQMKWSIEPVKITKINLNSVYVSDSKFTHRYKIKGNLPAMLDDKYGRWDRVTFLTDDPKFADKQNDLIKREKEYDEQIRERWGELSLNEKERVLDFIEKIEGK